MPPTANVAANAAVRPRAASVSIEDNKPAPLASLPEALRCSTPGCTAATATALQQQPLCIEHFFAHAYATLEQLESSYRGDANTSREPELAKARSLLNDCSIQALHVSMRSDNLTNLERGRLLDILLWSGELSETLRRSAKFNEPLIHRGSTKAASPDARQVTSQDPRSSAAGS